VRSNALDSGFHRVENRENQATPGKTPGPRRAFPAFLADVAEFTEAVGRVAAGGTALDREVVSQLLAASRHAGDLDPLTPRERDVLALMAEGRSNDGVAAVLVLTLGTV